MPQGLTKFLTRDELLDLARFVSELGRPGPYAVQTAKTIQRWRVYRDPPPELTQEVPHLEHLRQLVLGSPSTQWDPAYAQVAGALPLDELRPGHPDQPLILQGEFQVSTAGKVVVHVQSECGYQGWIDAEPLKTDKASEFSVATGRHMLTLRVEGSPPGTTPTLRVEFTAAPDSPVNYEMVGGP